MDNQIIQKTLQQVGDEAEKRYSNHAVRADAVDRAQAGIETAKSPNFGTEAAAFNDKGLAANLRNVEGNYNEDIAVAAEFAQGNAEQLHDLAVLEAHIGGVAINVEEPVVVGKKTVKRYWSGGEGLEEE